MRVLELYSGVGGMHLALQESGVCFEVSASVDINTNANLVYKHNFTEVRLINRNIEKLTVTEINDMGVDTILMSPPCQPFTRNGLKGDVSDYRSNSLMHLLDILKDLSITNILLENVKGFESSTMRELFINALTEANFVFQEFLLTPSLFGIPNSRQRYYCLAKKKSKAFKFDAGPLMCDLPEKYQSKKNQPYDLSHILDTTANSDDYKLSDEVLKKRIGVIDISYSDSKRSCCFTKAYGRYIEGTGSVYCDKPESTGKTLLEGLKKLNRDSEEYSECARQLGLRFFTPREVCRLMGFPEHFQFPVHISRKQQYMLLGNSINVKVVSELIKILCDYFLLYC